MDTQVQNSDESSGLDMKHREIICILGVAEAITCIRSPGRKKRDSQGGRMESERGKQRPGAEAEGKPV